MELQQLLLRDGREAGMCEEFRDELRSGPKTIAELCAMYHRGLDFCIEHKFPSLDFMKEHLDAEEIKRHGIYISNGISERQTNVVVLGDACVSIRVPNYCTCDITATDQAKVSVRLGIGAFCYVSLHNHASVLVAEKADEAKLNASVFDSACSIENQDQFNNIHIKYEEK